MTRCLLPALLLLLPASPTPAKGPVAMPALPLIPAPAAWSPDGGRLDPGGLVRIVVAGDDRAGARTAGLLAGWWREAAGRTLPVQTAGPGGPPAGSVVLRLTGTGPDRAPAIPGDVDETCTLELAPDRVVVTAAAPAGLFRGAAAVRQLVLAAAAGDGTLPTGRGRLSPRFRWRGMLLDSGRHLQDVATIEGVIDILALYGFNVLHWHLTEDQGWRLEIAGRPELTTVGAWRTEADGTRYGGFYTAAQVRRVVAYAAERFITVIPEIELPGHATAALAAYPELGCTGGPYAVETQWGVHQDVYCAGNDAVFALLADVFDQVVRLFPAAYVHVGGDEVPRDRWRACPRCRARLRAEGLADVDELQSWLMGRAETLLAERGRRLVGWDEILEGELPPGATVQSWRGVEGAVEAVAAGHDAIVSPTSHAYFDYDPGQLPLEQVLTFDPVPPGLDADAAARILGGEMNLWTEYVPQEAIGRQLFPRLAAMAEALGAPAGPRPLASFLDRLTLHEAVWPRLGIAAGAASRPLVVETTAGADGAVRVQAGLGRDAGRLLDGAVAGIEIAAWPRPESWLPDGRPEEMLDPASPAWREGATWTGAADAPTVVAARLLVRSAGGTVRRWGAPAAVELTPSLARGRPVALVHAPSPRYPGQGARPLTDGARGGRDFRDGRWIGFEGTDVDAMIDLGVPARVTAVAVRALQDANAWIFLPREVAVSVSDDGATWRPAGAAGHDLSDREQRKVIRDFTVPVDATVRYLRIVAAYPGPCPAWHPGRGRPCWVFVDEFEVR